MYLLHANITNIMTRMTVNYCVVNLM